MKKPILLAVVGCTLACAGSSQAQIIFDDFNVDEGHFNLAPTFSGTTVGEDASSTADRVETDSPFEGAGHQKLTLISDGGGTPLRIRHLSGSGSPAANITFDTTTGTDGFIGYYIRTTVEGFETQLNLDGRPFNTESFPARMYGSLSTPIIADGQWHLYEWSLDGAVWGDVPGIQGGGTGVLPEGNYNIDSIYFRDPAGAPSPSGDYFLDFVALNPDGSVAELTPVPEPSTYALVFGVLALGGAIVHRRRTQQA